MKTLIAILLCCCLLLSACGMLGERIKDPVTFYYVHRNYRSDLQTAISSEVREASGHRDDLPYLLALYSMGPSSENLQSPFPQSIRITPTEHTDNGIVLSLSDPLQNMSDAEYTLACTCLAMTCMELTSAEQITVVCADRSVTINADNILVVDASN